MATGVGHRGRGRREERERKIDQSLPSHGLHLGRASLLIGQASRIGAGKKKGEKGGGKGERRGKAPLSCSPHIYASARAQRVLPCTITRRPTRPKRERGGGKKGESLFRSIVRDPFARLQTVSETRPRRPPRDDGKKARGRERKALQILSPPFPALILTSRFRP